MKTQTRTQKSKRTPQMPAQPASQLKRTHLAGQTGIDAQARHRMIAEAAYYIAAQRHFQGGSAMEDWLQAEAQIDAKLLE